IILRHSSYTLFPYTTLFRSRQPAMFNACKCGLVNPPHWRGRNLPPSLSSASGVRHKRSCATPLLVGVSLLRQSQTWCSTFSSARSEEHTSELQSLRHLVCRL